MSAAQPCIRFCLELGMVALPKASSQAHIVQNASVDFNISEADMRTLLSLAPIKDYGTASEFPAGPPVSGNLPSSSL